MTAGRGVVHSERTPDDLRNSDKSLHGLQIWVALPVSLEECEPSFTHIPAEELPQWSKDGIDYKIIAGAIMGQKSPVPIHSSLYFVEIRAQHDQIVDIGEYLFGESALYILQGEAIIEGNAYTEKQILIAEDTRLCSFELKAKSVVYIFGGYALEEPRFMDWNFVSSSKSRIEKAKEDWEAQKFPKIPGETEWVSYPKF